MRAMSSLKIFALLVVVLATYGLQGALGQRGRGRGSEHGGGGHSVSKRSLASLMQYVPWVGRSRSESPAPSDNPDISFVESRSNASHSLRTDVAKALGLNSIEQNRRGVVKRSTEDAQSEQDLRSLFAQKVAGSRGLSPLVKGAAETVVIVQHPGPVSLKRALPVLPTTTPPPPPPVTTPITVPAVPVVPAAPAVPVVPAAPAVPVIPAAPTVPVVPVAPVVPAVSAVPVVPAVPAVPVVPAVSAAVLPSAVVVAAPVTAAPAPTVIVEADGSVEIALASTTPPPGSVVILPGRADTLAFEQAKKKLMSTTLPSVEKDDAQRAGKTATGARADTLAFEQAKAKLMSTTLPSVGGESPPAEAPESLLVPAEIARNDPHPISRDLSIS